MLEMTFSTRLEERTRVSGGVRAVPESFQRVPALKNSEDLQFLDFFD
jgi:hypothetical protein